MKKHLILLLLIPILSYSSLFACTVFYYSNGKIAWGGNSEDWSDPYYENVVVLNLKKELQKGKHTYDLASLFPEAYAGVYEIDPAVLPGYTIIVDKESDKLYMQMQFLDRTEIFPESDTQFFFMGIDETVEIRFKKNETDSASEIVIKMYGMEMPAKKIIHD